MSKNLTRKGLAFGAMVALTSTVIAGTPAFAIDEVTLAPKTGTSYSLISGETFTLTAATGSLVPSSSFGSLKTKVTNNSAIGFTTGATQTTAVFTGTGAQASTVTSVVIEDNDGGASVGFADITLVVGAADAGNFTVQSWLDANGNDLIDDAFVSPARTVTFVKKADVAAVTTITAPMAGDTAVSATVEFTGINNEQIPASHVGVQFLKGDGTALSTTAPTATAASSNGTTVTYTVANSLVAGQKVTTAGFTAAGFDLTGVVVASATSTQFTVTNALAAATATGFGTVANASSVVSNRTWSATDKFKFGIGNLAELASTAAVKVVPVYNLTGTIAATDTIATAATAPIAVRSIVTFTSDSNVTTTQNASEQVALNKAFSVYAKAVDGSTPVKPVAGKTVSYSVTQANLPATSAGVTSSTATLTINGVTYTNQAALPGATGVAKLTGVTNADGKVTVTGSSTGLTTGQTVVFAFSAENFTSSLTLTQTTITPTKAYITNYEGNAAAVASGASVSVNIAAYDQFGGAMADGYDARAVWASSTRTTTATTNTTAAVVAAVVGGKATLVLPDAGAGTGTNVWNVSLTKRDNASGSYTGTTSNLGTLTDFVTANAVTAFTVNFKAAADLVAGTIALTDGTTALALNTEKTKYVYTATQEGAVATPGDLTLDGFGTFDARGVVGTVPAPLKTIAGSVAAVAVDLAGTVSSTSTSTYAGAAIPGTTVTISGAGLQFQGVQGGVNVWTIGSITLNTDANGAFAVNIWSTKAGVQTVTVKSGAATSVVDLYFDAAAETSATSIAITAPKIIKSGKTLLVSAVVTDKFGNPVDTNQAAADARATGALTFAVTYDGPGFVIGDLPTKTDANGKISFRVLLGSADTGLGSVTVAYDVDGTATTNAAVTASANILYGVSATVAAGSKKANVVVKNAEGLTVKVVSGAKSTTKVATSDSYKLSLTKLTAGKKTVKVYVNDILVSSKSVTVKR